MRLLQYSMFASALLGVAEMRRDQISLVACSGFQSFPVAPRGLQHDVPGQQ